MITFMTLGGFLGAGKTTTLIAAAKHLQSTGRRVAVITNDQGTELVDTQLAQSGIDEVGEVTGGCFCCRFDDLLAVAQNLVDNHHIDTLLAEAVGSCTDLQATVVRPLRAYYGDRFTAGPLVTVVEPDRLRHLRTSLPLEDSESDISYLFAKQLQEADVIALNKTDLLDDAASAATLADLKVRHPAATVLGYSAKSGTGLAELVRQWLGPSAPDRNVEIDYDRYARAEAALAWLNETLTIGAVAGFDANVWARTLLASLSGATREHGWVVGHAKVSLESPLGLAKMSLTMTGGTPIADSTAAVPLAEAEVRINARIACDPRELDAAVAAAVDAATAATKAEVRHRSGESSFKPGYPQPVHRLPALAEGD
jgi:Ni2+-binding GTPase involved in maturation of urease and hydrogenase